MGRVCAVTNAEEIVEEMKKAGLEGNRRQDVTQDKDTGDSLSTSEMTDCSQQRPLPFVNLLYFHQQVRTCKCC